MRIGLFRRAALIAIIALALPVSRSSAVSAAEACLPAPPGLIQPGILTIGVSLAAAPTAFMKDDVASGLDPELMTAIAQKMCLKPAFVNMAFAGLFPALLASKIDVVHSQVGITDARKEIFEFVPVFVGGIRLIAGKKTGLYFQTEAETCGSTVAIMGGSVQQADLAKVKDTCPAGKPLVLKAFGGQAETLNDVSRGSSQAAFVDWPVAAYAAQQRPDDYVLASPVLSGKGPNTHRNRIGITLRKGETEAARDIEAAFKASVADGAYDRLLQKYALTEGDIRKAD